MGYSSGGFFYYAEKLWYRNQWLKNGEKMKTMILVVLMVSLILIAGCTTPAQDAGAATTTTGVPAEVLALAGNPLPMDRHVTLGTGNTSVDVSIDSFEVTPVAANGTGIVTVYVAAHNNATLPVMLVWFSKLTDSAGKTYGGIGISHDGNGARTYWIPYNRTEAARDFVTVHSDQDLAALKKGAVLDVYFFNKPSDDAPIASVPDYHVKWEINPGTII
jgi:hypothetical protein